MRSEGLRAEIQRLRAENEQLLEAQRQGDEAMERYLDLFEDAPLGYLVLDRAGAIRELNDLAAALLSGEPGRQHLIGRRLRSLVAERDHETLAQHLRRCAVARQPLVCELRLRDGKPVQLLSRRRSSAPRSYATLIIDLSERERAAEDNRRLNAAEKAARAANAAKDQFIAALSHELRTPLTPVLAAVSALLGRANLSDELRSLCQMIRRNVLTEARLVDDLLDVTRIARGKMQIDRRLIDVHEAAREAVQILRPEIEAKRLTIDVQLAAERHDASGDPLRLRQVFWNLLRNAVKFTPEGRAIGLRSWNSGTPGRPTLAIEVSDEGAGFAPSEAPSFKAFEQGAELPPRNGGLGLGLAICKGVIEMHGGRITAASRGKGLGARFTVELETALRGRAAVETSARPSVPAAPPVPASPAPARKPRILLIDDDVDTAATLEDLFNEAGYDVRSAGSAQAALAQDLDHVDVVVSDIGLPDVDGRALIGQLLAGHAIKGVALSGYGSEADIEASLRAGFSAHLTKPIDFDGLVTAIDRVWSPH